MYILFCFFLILVLFYNVCICVKIFLLEVVEMIGIFRIKIIEVFFKVCCYYMCVY